MAQFKIEEVLSGTSVFDTLDEESIKLFLNILRSLDNMIILLADHSFDDKLKEKSKEEDDQKFLSDNTLSNHSAIYQLDYSIKKMSEETKKNLL